MGAETTHWTARIGDRVSPRSTRPAAAVLAIVLIVCGGQTLADEGGVSFWLPGQYGSLVAVPRTQDGRLH